VSTRLVRCPADFFVLSEDDLREVAGMPPRSAANLIRSISRSRGPSLARVLTALGIPSVGARTAQILAEEFGTLGALCRASVARLSALAGVGPVAAREIVTFLHSAPSQRLIARLEASGALGETRRRSGPAHADLEKGVRAATVL
jgi:DNA ligase (NAD+)